MAYPYNGSDPNQPWNHGYPMAQKPDNLLVWTILSTLFCCWPVGGFGIYYSTQVDKFWWMGLYNEAYDAANKAKNFAIISAAIVLVPVGLYAVALAFAFMFSHL